MSNQEVNSDGMEWTGERMVPVSQPSIGSVEHLHRYALALEIVTGRDVVDIASGEGYGSNLLSTSAAHVTGIDISEDSIKFASGKYSSDRLAFKVGSAAEIPLDDNSVEVVVSFETLEHHTFHDEMMEEVKRVLRPGGLMLISTPEKSIYSKKDPDNQYHVKELTFDEFENLMQRYFKNLAFLTQQNVFGSLILPRIGTNNSLRIFRGDFSTVDAGLNPSHRQMSQPFYNICFASDGPLPQMTSSLFDGGEIYEEMERHLSESIVRANSLLELSVSLGKTALRPVKNAIKSIVIRKK